MLRHVLRLARQHRLGPAVCSTVIPAASTAGASSLSTVPLAATPVSSNGGLLQLPWIPPSSRSITSKPHKTPGDAQNDDALLEKHAATSETLQQLGLSFSAMMAVLRHSHRPRVYMSKAVTRIQQLQAYFGPALTNDMLSLAPDLLERDPQRLTAYFEGLVVVLGSKRTALHIVKRAPDIIQHKPETVQARLELLEQLLQVDRAAIMRVVRKGPTIIKADPTKRITAIVSFLNETAGMTPPEVCRVLQSWPVMATTTVALLRKRYKALQQVLQVKPDAMKRLCRVYPNMLGRDPAQLSNNIDTLAEKLRVPKEDLMDIIRAEPGLLSFNVSTLVNRVMAVSQILKLTPKLSVTLLTYNRPLIGVVPQLPQRLEALRRLTGVTDDELYSMVHKHLNIMRFPIESNEAKLASVGSLVQLHPPWLQQRKNQPMSSTLRELQAGWGCHWRLVYLLHTGQQGSINAQAAIRMSHAKFKEAYPDFPEWLDRYNAAVCAADIPIFSSHLPTTGPVDLIGPTTYQAVLPDASMGKGLHAGSMYVRIRQKREAGYPNSQLQYASWLLPAGVLDSKQGLVSNYSSSLSNIEAQNDSEVVSEAAADQQFGAGSMGGGTADMGGKHTSSSRDHTGSASAGLKHVLPVSPAGRLAAWLGIEYEQAEQLLQHEKLAALQWQEWQTRLSAAAAYLGVAIDHTANGVANDAEQNVDSHLADGASSSSSSRAAAAVASIAVSTAPPTPSSHLLPGEMSVDQSLQQQPAKQRTWEPQGQQQYEQQQQQEVEFVAPPSTQAALQHAVETRHAAAIAAVSVACLLVPFAKQLYSTPPRPPDYAVQFVLQHPDSFVMKYFVENCTRLATLAWASIALRQHLQQQPPEWSAMLAGCISARLKYVQYLVQTQQPMPWKYDLHMLLLPSYRSGGTVRRLFVKAYPGFEQWEKFHEQDL